MQTTHINIRSDVETKSKAQEIFASLGLDWMKLTNCISASRQHRCFDPVFNNDLCCVGVVQPFSAAGNELFLAGRQWIFT